MGRPKRNLHSLFLLWISLSLVLGQLMAQEQEGATVVVEELTDERMPGIIWQQLKDDPYVKEHLGWKIAFCQHPMYLLIDEDRGIPTVGERVPPWGAQTAAEYVKRVERNLHSLETYPDLRLNYQWSAMELASMAQRFPDTYAGLKGHYEKGTLDFLDGTYSQAHLHVLGSESNWRQFEYGQEIYRDLFDMHPTVYARQETGLHLQLPQLLRQFNYKYAMLPAFISVIEFGHGGKIEIINQETYEPIADEEFIAALGLDGSTIPTYLINTGWEEETFQKEFQQDVYSGPKIWTRFPDLDEVDRETYEFFNSMFDFVLLGKALDERHAVAPPKATARIYSYWSYLEGVWAEELMRTNRAAEDMAVMTEALCGMTQLAGFSMDKHEELKLIWHDILKAQHHDISWIEVTDLRRKSIDRLRGTIDSCQKILSDITTQLLAPDDQSLTVFNWLPRARRCRLELDEGKALDSGSTFQAFNGRSIGFVDLPPGGFKSFKIAGEPTIPKISPMPGTITGRHYSIELSPEGLMKQIITQRGKELLKPGEYLGGEIRARIDKQWVNNRVAECTFYTGEVCDILERVTSIGHIPTLERYYFFKNEPFIKVEVEFDFNGDEVGYMWIDETKLNVYYPTSGSQVYHDIPFGYVEARQDRSIYPITWLYTGGLVYVNCGTIKHWVHDGVIANVLAWGSTHFSNRLHWDWLEYNQYDIRLYGKQKIEYYLMPYKRFDGKRIVQDVAAITAPVYLAEGQGEHSYYNLKKEDLAVTGIYHKDGTVWLRGYQLPVKKKRSGYRNWEIVNQPITELK